MPYEIRKRDDEYCVFKVGDEEPLGCHASEEDAAEQMRAIHASEKQAQRPTQVEVGYQLVSTETGKACANCRWYDTDVSMCHLIENYPDDILLTGLCERHEARLSEADAAPDADPVPDMDDDTQEVMAMAEAETPEDKAVEVLPVPVVVSSDKSPSALSKVWQQVKRALFPGRETRPFEVVDAGGRVFWVARYTNNFEDRDGEIFSEKAHDRYLARLDAGLTPMPELWLWHTKATRHGQAQMVARIGHVVIAVGTFEDTPLAQKAVAYYRKHAGEITLSHGYTYPKWALADGVYEDYNTFEISTLQAGSESNPYTTFEEIVTMALSDKQRAWLTEMLGADETARIVEDTEKQSKAVEELGAKYKDFADIPAAEADAADDKGVAEVNIPALLKTVADLIEAQGALDKQFSDTSANLDTARKAYEAQRQADADALAALKSEVADLKAQLNARPRSASRAQETEIEASAIPQSIKDALTKRDTFWGTEVKEG